MPADLFSVANYAEAGLWLVVAATFFVLAARARTGARSRCVLAGILFALFGLSDVVEVQTGAWWRPWWLLLWKASGVVALAGLLVEYRLRCRSSSSGE